jgi:anti-anti-sigma regulatory factor
MKITQEINNKKATLKLEGNFTYTQRKAFQEALKTVCTDPSRGSRHRPVPGRVSRQRGIGVADDQPSAIGAEKRKLSLAYPQPTVRQIIELANLHKTIPMIESGVSSLAKKSA